MIRIGLCRFSECPKANECFRFKHQLGEIMDFKYICNESNDYIRFWAMENNIVENSDNNTNSINESEVKNNG